MKKISKIKRIGTLGLVFLMSINSFATSVSDNDGSAFISKSEFDALKASFQSQIDTYNQGIDSKIDSAIAAYLAGISLKQTEDPQLITPLIKNIKWIDGFYLKKTIETFNNFPSGHTLIGKSISSNLASARTNPGSSTTYDYTWDESEMYDPVDYGSWGSQHVVKWCDMDDAHEVVGACWKFNIDSYATRGIQNYFQPMMCIDYNTTLGTKTLAYLYISSYYMKMNQYSYGADTVIFKPGAYCVADGYNHGYPGSFGQNPSRMPNTNNEAFRVSLYTNGALKSTDAPSKWADGSYDIVIPFKDSGYWNALSSYTQYKSSTAWENYFRQGTGNKMIDVSSVFTRDCSNYMFGIKNEQRAYMVQSSTKQYVGKYNSAFNGTRTTRDLTYSSLHGYWMDTYKNTDTAWKNFQEVVRPWEYNWAQKAPSTAKSPRLNIPNHWGFKYFREFQSDLLSGTEEKPYLYQGCPLFKANLNGVYRIKMTTTNSSSTSCTNKISFKIGAFENTTGNGNTLKLSDANGNDLSTYASQLTANDGTNKFDYYIKCEKGDVVWVKLSPTNAQSQYAKITDVQLSGKTIM